MAILNSYEVTGPKAEYEHCGLPNAAAMHLKAKLDRRR
jgi:hypothetical protein